MTVLSLVSGSQQSHPEALSRLETPRRHLRPYMADKPNTEKKIKAKAAKASDTAADKSASPAAAPEAPRPGTARKKGKLLPKNKHRLPRRQKKAQQKGAAQL
jgi:hypothetical protein